MPQLSIEVVYYDEDLNFTQILAIANNGRYAGCATIEVNYENLIEFGHRLKCFPKNITHVEEQEFGFTKKFQEEFKKKYPETKTVRRVHSSAYMSLKFYSIDNLGHSAVYVYVIIEEDSQSERAEAAGKASFEIRFEPAQMESFANEIIELGKKKSGKAILVGIHDNKDTFI